MGRENKKRAKRERVIELAKNCGFEGTTYEDAIKFFNDDESISKKIRIKVYNYHSGHSIMHPKAPSEVPDVYEVDAFCVDGEYGIFAIFTDPNDPDIVMTAQGDDGHWWFAGCFHKIWLKQYLKAFVLMYIDIKE